MYTITVFSYPETIATFPGSQFFAVIFFIMLFTLGIGSSVADAGAIIALFCDRFHKIPRWMITATICSVGFLLGIPYVTPGGQFILNLGMNWKFFSVIAYFY